MKEQLSSIQAAGAIPADCKMCAAGPFVAAGRNARLLEVSA